MVEPVVKCPGCGITVFASSDNETGYCTGCAKNRRWQPSPLSNDRYEVEFDDRVDHRFVQPQARFRYRVRSEVADHQERPWWQGTPPTPAPTIPSRVETEHNMNWARANPELFIDSLRRFGEDHTSPEWETHVSFRSFYMTLIAVRKGS